MALDWSKEITFSGLRKRTPKAKATYPSKTYINLMMRDKRQVEANRVLPFAIVLVLVVALFCKFGIFDFYERVNQKQAELNAQEQVLGGLEAQLENYDAVKAEYDTYESSRIVANGDMVSAMDALALVDRYVAPSASIASIDLQGNTVSLNLAGISLDGVGKLVSTLYEQPVVANVSVSTAATDKADAKETTAAMVITLQPVSEAEKAEATAGAAAASQAEGGQGA